MINNSVTKDKFPDIKSKSSFEQLHIMTPSSTDTQLEKHFSVNIIQSIHNLKCFN